MRGSSRIPILLYHSVREHPAPLLRDWSVSPATFEEHVTALAATGHTALTVSELTDALDSRTPLPARPVVITFDDGFDDVHGAALPALRAGGLTATVYVSTAYVGGSSTWLGPDGRQPMMDWTQVRDLVDAGIEIGAHAHHHVALDELSDDRAYHEVVTSRDVLADRLGTPIRSFAYPHGYHDRRTRRIVQASGFTSASAVKHAVSHSDDDRFGLARIIVPRTARADDLLALMSDLPVAPVRERPRTRAWRLARRARTQLRGRPERVGVP
jgi:peptidoglycan/xylan/chitin deacetylase (PgdA/CDA1 family)